MKFLFKLQTTVLIALLISLSCSSALCDDDLDKLRIKKFNEINFQRSWYYAVKLIPAGSPDIQKEHARIMVSTAFHYWIMRQEGLIDEMLTYESQIKKSFRENELNADLLKDPLRLLSKDGPEYALSGFSFDIEEYKKLIPKFREFITIPEK